MLKDVSLWSDRWAALDHMRGSCWSQWRRVFTISDLIVWRRMLNASMAFLWGGWGAFRDICSADATGFHVSHWVISDNCSLTHGVVFLASILEPWQNSKRNSKSSVLAYFGKSPAAVSATITHGRYLNYRQIYYLINSIGASHTCSITAKLF